jgi:hypothetical protein
MDTNKSYASKIGNWISFHRAIVENRHVPQKDEKRKPGTLFILFTLISSLLEKD